ncbi:MAG: inverse autotransporter beta domain-containing protein [Gammaproteobacteria bacterium]|nr:inverse autotransporter beta domain-containing protein [Gammaproteobacteria bacterium]
MALYTASPVLAADSGHSNRGGVNLGARIGNDTGEGFVDFILPLRTREDSILFLNPRASLKDEGETELNLGLVYRHQLPGRNVIFGANAYLDRRESRHGNTFNQTGLGLEVLSNWVDARLNYYHPNDNVEMIAEAQTTDVDVDVDTSTSVSRDTERSVIGSSTTDSGDLRFNGNNLVTGGSITEDTIRTATTTTTTVTRRITTTTTDRFFEQFEQGREGWDAEIMFRLPFGDRFPQTRLGVGYYDYSSGFRGGRGISGMKSRLEMRAGPYVTLDAEIFEDEELNGTSYFLGARLHLPFDMARLVNGKNPFADVKNRIRRHNQAPFNERLDEMVMRDVRIQMEESDFLENPQRRHEEADVQVQSASSTRTEESVSTEATTDAPETLTRNGNPVTIVHIDDVNTGDPENDAGAPAGTYENPHTGATSANNDPLDSDIILVHAASNIDDAAIQADSNDRVLGEGNGATHIVVTDQGSIELPETAPGAQAAPRPNIAGVTINSTDVEVSNFTVDTGSISTAAGPSHTNITVRRINSSDNTSDSVINLGTGSTLGGTIALSDIYISNHTGGTSAISLFNGEAAAQISGTNITIDGTNGTGLMLGGSTTGSSHVFTGLSISGTGEEGLHIDGAGGMFTFDSGTTISDPDGPAYREDGGSATVTYNGTINQTNAASAVAVDGKSGGTTAFNGAVTANTGTADAVNLTNNTNGTISFNGGLDIDTTSGTGFNATGGGTVNITGGGNTIDTGTGTGVNITDTTIGAGGVTLASVNVDGAASGIVLDDTGSTGAFTVTGDGTGGRNDTGGIIQNTTGHGVSLTNANGVTLQSMRIDTLDTDGTHGINSSGGSNIQLTGVTVQNLNGAGSQGWRARDLGGINGAEGSLFTALGTDAGGAIDLVNTDTNMTSFTIDDTDFTNQNADYPATVVRIAGQGTSDMGNVTVQNGSLFSELAGTALAISAADTASMVTVIDDNTFDDIGGQGIRVDSTRTATAGQMDVTISNNVMDDIGREAIFVSAENSALDFDLQVTSNQIGQSAPVASAAGDGITIRVLEDANLNALIENNTVRVDSAFDEVMELYTDRVFVGDTPVLNATVTNNTFTNSNNGLDAGNVRVVTESSADTICLNMTNNFIANVDTIDLDNSASGTFNVTQASELAMETDNGGANVTTLGTISFNQLSCTLPTF